MSSPATPVAIDLDDPGSFWARQLRFARNKKAYRLELEHQPRGWELVLRWRAGPGQVSKTVRLPEIAMDQWRAAVVQQAADRHVLLQQDGSIFRLALSAAPFANVYASNDVVRLWPWCKQFDERKRLEASTAQVAPRKTGGPRL